ncbi:phosphate ABC transporter substrate-binding protein, PhoT family [Desulfocicer vacuolatum DSM 3385]|uniref:Phosphate-binding protein n=1 Tax=Desulfocicer vacuolatum DSM 3385 TaxID=1121400 RepID=A0A1W2E688_9BACT|nr:phosphate ABC transporter substrate-binding protein [Desulfocicer vacuolatum]SMD05313.1 phosphate ABC transporter substrate-binding protein, PhoT family [Desulfocicer vacuolatum DSM 3385]
MKFFMNTLKHLSWLLACCFILVSSSPAESIDSFTGEKGTLRISGGTAHIPVMKIAAQKIMDTHPDIQITIAGGGSGAGIKQVGEGLVQIGNSGRKASDAEIQKYELSLYKWAIDGVGTVVHPDNPVQALTSQQLQDIFAGKINNWKQLGGSDRAINVYTRDESSGTRSVFWKKALAKGDISPKAQFASSNGAMKTAVAKNPYAIGYMSVGYIDQSVAPVSLDGVRPDLETVKSGKYKVSRGLYSNTKGPATGLAEKFINYLLSPEGQNIVVQKGFVPVR